MIELNELKVVLLNGVFSQINNPEIGELFVKLLQLKKNGYQGYHSERFIPVGTHDFFGIHLLICEEKTMTPILCSKVVSYESCKYHNVAFPLMNLTDVFSHDEQSEVDKIISERLRLGRDLSYSGGLTINPKFKGFGQSDFFKDMYSGLHYLLHEDYQLETMMGFATPKVGTDAFFARWGVKPLNVEGLEMKATPLPFANGAESFLVWGDLENLSDYKKEMGLKYRKLWDNRLEFSMNKAQLRAA
jgi:hypothetical protein